MSDTHSNVPKTRRPGYEYWGRRSALCGLRCAGRYTKMRTHRAERREGRVQVTVVGTWKAGERMRVLVRGITTDEELASDYQ